MKKYFSQLVLLFSLLSILQPAIAQDEEAVDAAAFAAGVQQPGVQVFDVRTAAEFGSGHLHNALQADYTKQEEFVERVKYLNPQQPVYVYCLSGGRSAAAAKWMRQHGFAKVVELKGGINAWKQAGQPLEGVKAGKQLEVAAFNNAIQSGLVLVDVGAEWCPPCRKMEPVLQQVLQAHKNLKLVRVNGGRDQQVMQSLKAATLPTFIIYKNGKEVWRRQGVFEREAFEQALR